MLAVLVEKQRSVPDTYPMSLNALVAGCNQKTSRAPIMNVSDADVLQALDVLNGFSLIVETSGGRVMRYAHNAERVLALPTQSVALLSTLVLRGPQTAGELRLNSERLHRFSDISAVEGFLHELAERAAGSLVAELPRVPGTRETRWTQLLTGAPPAADPACVGAAGAGRVGRRQGFEPPRGRARCVAGRSRGAEVSRRRASGEGVRHLTRAEQQAVDA